MLQFNKDFNCKQLHNEFKTIAGSTNSRYRLRAALRIYNLFHTCENILQNPIFQPLKIQYIGKLTELKFQQFSDQISSIILDYYLEITNSTWTSTELSLEEKLHKVTGMELAIPLISPAIQIIRDNLKINSVTRVEKWDNEPCLTCGETFLDEKMWNNISGRERTSVKHLNGCPHNDDKIWQMALAKIKGALPEEIKMIKNNPPKEEQEQWLEEINTKLCDFQYCNECDLIYNLPICMIYTIPNEKEPISSCTSKLESTFNLDSNSNNNDNENNDSSSVQYDNKKYSNSDSDLNSEKYITLPDLTKEQELK
ncbi:hypothetical protein G9A89_012667 [Geosiphon pyriformis]|nr:hypothetical protein G9A89_012667 [Geosiphon pyriformis]